MSKKNHKLAEEMFKVSSQKHCKYRVFYASLRLYGFHGFNKLFVVYTVVFQLCRKQTKKDGITCDNSKWLYFMNL